MIPVWLALLLAVSLPAASVDAATDGTMDGFRPVDPVLETVKDGYIDWTSGRVYAWGRTPSRQTRHMGDSDALKKQIATQAAGRRLEEILGVVRLASGRSLAEVPGGLEMAARVTEGAVEEQTRERRGRDLEVQLSAPLHGRGSILEELASPGETEGGKAGTGEGKGPTGIVIDARGTGLRPALQPRILDSAGDALWSWEQADPVARVRRGMLAYGRLTRIHRPEPSSLEWQRDPVLTRMGERPVFLTASGASGPVPCDLRLEGEAAERLGSDPVLRALLARGQLVVVVD